LNALGQDHARLHVGDVLLAGGQSAGAWDSGNPREPDVPEGHLSLPLGALAALQEIDRRLTALTGGA
jgi:hypothetical protein